MKIFTRNRIILSLLSLAYLGVFMTTYVANTSADTVPPIIQAVNHQSEVLDNHEARIKNLENDTKDLQTKTETPPSQANTPAPPVVTPKPTEPIVLPPATVPDPQPAPTNTNHGGNGGACTDGAKPIPCH